MLEEEDPRIMFCIFCLKEKPPRSDGGEHVVPKGLGGSFTIDRVCLDCDNYLGGKVDRTLQEQNDLKIRRIELQLRGQRGEIPDLYRDAIGKAVIPDETRPQFRLRVKRQGNGDVGLKVEPYIEFLTTSEPDGRTRIEVKHCHLDPGDLDKGTALIRRALQEKGIGDEQTVAAVVSSLIPTLEPVEEALPIRLPFLVNTGGHQLGIVKIAYEMAWFWLGDEWLDDPVAQAMRAVLWGDSAHFANVLVAIFEPKGRFELAKEADTHHVILTLPGSDRTVVVVRLFDAHMVSVRVSATPERYQQPDKPVLIMDAIARTNEQLTLASFEDRVSAA